MNLENEDLGLYGAGEMEYKKDGSDIFIKGWDISPESSYEEEYGDGIDGPIRPYSIPDGFLEQETCNGG